MSPTSSNSDDPSGVTVRELRSADETRAAGAELGRRLRGGELIALSGPLGAGKTEFVKGLAQGLDVPADEPVVSPTFVLVREYAGRLKLYHLDAYRLQTASELSGLGFDEMRADPRAVVVIEWADRVSSALHPALISVEIEYSDTGRRLMIREG